MDNCELRQWRKAAELTQEQAADFFGIKVQQYRKFEYGTASIRKPVENAITQYYLIIYLLCFSRTLIGLTLPEQLVK